MDDRQGIRQLFWHRVMIGDDQIQADLSRQGGFSCTGYSAINGDNQTIGIRLMQLSQCIAVQTVAFFQSAWNVVVDLRSGQLQTLLENGGRCHAIDVVIAINGDAAILLYRLYNLLCRL